MTPSAEVLRDWATQREFDAPWDWDAMGGCLLIVIVVMAWVLWSGRRR